MKQNRYVGFLILLVYGAGMIAEALAAEPLPLSVTESALQAEAMEKAARLPRLRSLLVSVNGKLVDEGYFHGATRSHWANLKSASKSVLSILIGIAIDQGHLESVRDRINKFFPEYLAVEHAAAKKVITIEDLLTMRSGLESTSSRNYGRWVQSGNWVRHVLTRPMRDVPGGRMIYSTGNSHLLSAILTKASGMDTLRFARRYLGEPLGIGIRPWFRDPQGIYFGGNEMHLTPRAMLEIGELYLRGGRLGEEQLVSNEWIRESLRRRTQSPRNGNGYGYGWWMRNLAGHRTHYAWGYGGQFIFLVPELELVVVTTSSPQPGRGRRAHRQAIYDLMEYHLIPAAQSRVAASRHYGADR